MMRQVIRDARDLRPLVHTPYEWIRLKLGVSQKELDQVKLSVDLGDNTVLNRILGALAMIEGRHVVRRLYEILAESSGSDYARRFAEKFIREFSDLFDLYAYTIIGSIHRVGNRTEIRLAGCETLKKELVELYQRARVEPTSAITRVLSPAETPLAYLSVLAALDAYYTLDPGIRTAHGDGFLPVKTIGVQALALSRRVRRRGVESYVQMLGVDNVFWLKLMRAIDGRATESLIRKLQHAEAAVIFHTNLIQSEFNVYYVLLRPVVALSYVLCRFGVVEDKRGRELFFTIPLLSPVSPDANRKPALARLGTYLYVILSILLVELERLARELANGSLITLMDRCFRISIETPRSRGHGGS